MGMIVWAVFVTTTGGVASIAWGDAGIGAAIVGAAACAAVCALAIRLARAHFVSAETRR